LGQLLPAAAVPMGIVIDCDLGRQRGMLGCFFAAFNSEISERCSILHTGGKLGIAGSGFARAAARRHV